MKKFVMVLVPFGLLLLIIGACLAYSSMSADKQGEWAQESLYKQGEKAPKQAKKKETYSVEQIQNLSTEDLKKYASDPNVKNYVAGKIDIPSLNIYLPILEGVSNRNLAVGAATLKANQSLERGNFALGGHHMRNPHLLFGALANAKKGKMIAVTYNGQSAKYVITDVRLIGAYDGHVIHDTEGNQIITLITCDATGKNRYMVRGKLV
ncbi:class A sortase [Listeria kieliensis]